MPSASPVSGPAQPWPCASINARRSFSSDMSSSAEGRSGSPPPMSRAIESSSGSSTSIWVWFDSIRRSRSSSADCVSSAISRRATTGFLSLSRATVIGAPAATSRARCAASITSSKRFGTLSTQSSVVTRAIGPPVSHLSHLARDGLSKASDRDLQARNQRGRQGQIATAYPSKRHDLRTLFLGQRRQHLGHALPQHRMPPVGRHIRQRHQHKAPVLQARMRQDQTIGRARALLIGWQIAPHPIRFDVRQHRIAHRDQIQIQSALPPPRHPFAPELGLDLMQQRQHVLGTASARHYRRRIHEIRPRTGGKTRCGKEPADRLQRAAMRLKTRQRQPQGHCRCALFRRHISAQGDQGAFTPVHPILSFRAFYQYCVSPRLSYLYRPATVEGYHSQIYSIDRCWYNSEGLLYVL